jgi:NhaP-type Na+/H+ or K+/H+ antiporter
LAGSSHEDLPILTTTSVANVGNTVIVPIVAVVVLVTDVIYGFLVDMVTQTSGLMGKRGKETTWKT